MGIAYYFAFSNQRKWRTQTHARRKLTNTKLRSWKQTWYEFNGAFLSVV